MKNIFQISLILLIIINIMLIPKVTYAMDDVISQGDSFINAGKGQEKIDTDALKATSNDIYNILFTIAVVLAVAVGMVIGIQFMLGGAEEQAKVKETLIPYVIGVFVVFASFTIWKIAVNIGNDVTSVSSGESDTTGGSSTSTIRKDMPTKDTYYTLK